MSAEEEEQLNFDDADLEADLDAAAGEADGEAAPEDAAEAAGEDGEEEDDEDDADMEALKAFNSESQKEADDLDNQEAEKLKQLQQQQNSAMNISGQPPQSNEAREVVDARSIFVGNCDYNASFEEIQQHFKACGIVKRITIVHDKFTGKPKGCSYIEFDDPASVDLALALDESTFRGRQIKVSRKRTNLPGMARGRGRGGRGRGRGFRGRGRGRGARGSRNRTAHFAPY
eukprot:m.71456 g.71456  ORF g.71456 m.71456 type:complete len:230 (-) comp7942_c0_seq1:123-812(-)